MLQNFHDNYSLEPLDSNKVQTVHIISHETIY